MRKIEITEEQFKKIEELKDIISFSIGVEKELLDKYKPDVQSSYYSNYIKKAFIVNLIEEYISSDSPFCVNDITEDGIVCKFGLKESIAEMLLSCNVAKRLTALVDLLDVVDEFETERCDYNKAVVGLITDPVAFFNKIFFSEIDKIAFDKFGRVL